MNIFFFIKKRYINNIMWFLSGLTKEYEFADNNEFIKLIPANLFTEAEITQFINLEVTKDNYLRLIELSDYLIVEDIDPLVDKIVECYDNDLSIINTFSQAYKLNSARINIGDKTESLKGKWQW